MSGPADPSREELIAAGRAKDARIAELVGRNEALSAAHGELTAAYEQLVTEHEQLVTAHEQLRTASEELAAKVAKLEHLLSRNSGNSSMPPSTDDGPGKKAPKGKGRSTPKRAKGKQPGAPGSYLSWSDAPDDQQDRFPEGSCECGLDLGGALDLGVVDSYQQTEIPMMRAAVTQFDQHAVRCGCGKVHTAARPEGAREGRVGYGPVLHAWAVFLMVVHHLPTHRCRQVLEALTGAQPSIGFVHGLLARVGAALRVADQRIRTLITLVRVFCMDETPIRVGPKTPRPGRKKADKYLLIACTKLYTHFLLGDRDLATFKASVLNDVAAGTRPGPSSCTTATRCMTTRRSRTWSTSCALMIMPTSRLCRHRRGGRCVARQTQLRRRHNRGRLTGMPGGRMPTSSSGLPRGRHRPGALASQVGVWEGPSRAPVGQRSSCGRTSPWSRSTSLDRLRLCRHPWSGHPRRPVVSLRTSA